MDAVGNDKVVLVLTTWEAHDLRMMLERIKRQKTVGKSEFTMREKRTGRRTLDLLTEMLVAKHKSVKES